ncbi:MBL fold metallo-hydrolase [Planomonospora venezuelensis]|uniref:Glyoxylase-like metal-dependent hydrolase (Beta-lactamase superfamily II) n=1 Tax=Planomonospora venezuelensis TaxID=1999 RepID=A0A841D5T2_PLAVE|nr:MBL fold metallo-hydrolase [Planomonospora venezuelensis]MBB5966002.1 glyoxylase-like metal-dependent hydrolase (beta-lactamase superfamily II) [Planomonospora venezuelensis]GIN02346.1 MBL fold metallo-hydrolase [Planomonospora venezuelensis]
MPLYVPPQPAPVTIGRRTIVPLIDAAGDVLPPERLFPGLPASDLARLLAADGMREPMVVTGFAIVGAGTTILVDTCLGGRKQGRNGPFPGFTSRWMTTLAEAGIDPAAVDTVVNTHLHHDHVGWNTTDTLRPAFPAARYLLAEAEYGRLADGGIRHAERIAQCVHPVEKAGQLDLVAGAHRIDDGVRLVPAPGHTPGHLIVEITDEGRTAVIAGDLLHHPLQLTRPDISSSFCDDPEQAAESRHRVLADLAARTGVLLAAHLPRAGEIHRRGGGFALQEASSRSVRPPGPPEAVARRPAEPARRNPAGPAGPRVRGAQADGADGRSA